MATVVRRAPYKDFLQPALQRRFASTAGVVLGLAYIESLTLSSWDSLIWSWFPFGYTGLRALAIFACVLPLIILRIAHHHIGLRTSSSPFETFCRTIVDFQFPETVFTYVVSFWFFSQVYLFGIPEESNMWWITYYSGDRPRLNERALFYTVNLVLVGIARALVHLVEDHDRLKIGQANPPTQDDPWQVWPFEVYRVLTRSGTVAIATSLANYTVLYSLLRDSAWSWAMTFFRTFYHNLPKSNIPPNQAPWSIWMLGRSLWAAFLFVALWDISSFTFTLQHEKAPLKNNLPLTAESRDPNGSLVNGLKSKKPRTQAFAFQELACIVRDFEDRRKSIFEDIDRRDGPIWSQLYAVCLNLIQSIEQRIDDYRNPPAPPVVPQQGQTQPPGPQQRAAQAPSNDDVWQPAATSKGFRGSIRKAIGNVKITGKTPAEVLGPEAKRISLEARDQLLTPEQKEALTTEGLNGAFQYLALRIIRIPYLGDFFQQKFPRRITKVILGTPYGEPSLYVNAAFILSELAVCSLTEDQFGNVQRDVPTIIRTFTSVIRKLEQFRDELPGHWTDMAQDKTCEELHDLLLSLKVGLGRLIEAFGTYSADLRLSRADMRLAREAARIEPTP
ncbi:hypothetical protein SLS62_002231 [Diatrype stigma]|uniref:Nucleoporin NDC1 n=1 Tax=Diatrype stigma TaxID=117547 RepID=A0AAN9UYG0_9PEZI